MRNSYREPTGVQYLKHATAPFLPGKMAPDFSDGYATERGEAEAAKIRNAADLQRYAAKVLMKVLYTALCATLTQPYSSVSQDGLATNPASVESTSLQIPTSQATQSCRVPRVAYI